MSTVPTGRVVEVDGAPVLVLERTFHAPIEDVWASVTEPERLDRWIGTWTGDPASGSVEFTMSAEEGAEPETMLIRECEPPRSLKVTSQSPVGTWVMDIALTERDGTTLLTFSHPDLPDGQAESVGPGWEYYLDRWAATLEGRAVTGVVWDDYFPSMRAHYQQAWIAVAG